jgi:hypothetical protein
MTNLAAQIEITGVRDQVDITSVTGKANITNSETNMRDITNILASQGHYGFHSFPVVG